MTIGKTTASVSGELPCVQCQQFIKEYDDAIAFDKVVECSKNFHSNCFTALVESRVNRLKGFSITQVKNSGSITSTSSQSTVFGDIPVHLPHLQSKKKDIPDESEYSSAH